MRSLIALGLLTASAATQSILTVGPGGFAQIGDAILAATPGDIVHIAGGTYRPFSLNKGITLRAIGTVQVSVLHDAVQLDTIVQVPAGQHARISGLTFLPGALAGHVIATGGMLSLDACWFDFFTTTPALEVNGGSVVAWNCQFTGNPGVLVQSSSFAAVHCGFNGSLAGPATAGGNGLEVVDGSVQLAWCQPRGGHSVGATGPAGNGLVVHGDASISVSDSILSGGNALNASLPGIGLVNNSSTPLRHARCWFVGGTHPVLPHGTASVGLRQLAPLLGITIDPMVFRIGVTNGVRVATTPGALVFLVGSLSLQPPQTLPQVAEPVWAPLGNALTIGVGFAGAQVAVFSLAIPNDPALRDLGIWLHAVTPGPVQWEISPPAGMVVR